jgi:hypothetical protein
MFFLLRFGLKLGIIAGFTALLNTLCYANTDKWVLARDSDGIKIYQQQTVSGYPITRAIAEMETSPQTLVALMKDRSLCQKWVHSCKSGHLVKQINPHKRLDYTLLSTPLWFADRDMYIQTTQSFDSTSKTTVLRLNGKENYDKGQANRVRIKHIQGFWRIQKITGHKVKLVYQMYSNPQVPSSRFLNAYIVETTFQTVNRLKRLAENRVNKKY